MFLDFSLGGNSSAGTPKKKRKLNEIAAFDEQEGLFNLKKKKSFIDTFQFIGNIKRKDSCQILDFHRNASFKISDWDDIARDEKQGQIIFPNFNETKNSIEERQEIDSLPPVKIAKKMTMVDETLNDCNLNLYRHNSTFDPDKNLNEGEEIKYGANVYLQQILQKKSNESENKIAFDDEEQDGDRLLHDYQIKDNVTNHTKHHENYICLNKLDQLFYYVKKIRSSDESNSIILTELSNLQIRTYNKDDCDRLVRFYQSWQEDQNLYLIFQMASTSILEKTLSGLKLRENEVWSVLTDCCGTLQWMNEELSISHLNIKPGNILKCGDRYKLADPFGSAEMLKKIMGLEDGEEKLRMYFSYAAPEILSYHRWMQGLDLLRADMYSLGICILENLTQTPVHILNLKRIRRNTEKYLRGYSHALRTLIMKMVSIEPRNRPLPADILSFPDFCSQKKIEKRKLSL